MKRSKAKEAQPLPVAVLPDVRVPVPSDSNDSPSSDQRRKLSLAEIRRRTGLSQQRISQRRARGETDAEIVAAVESRKAAEQKALDAERTHRSSTGDGTDTLPPLSVSVRIKAAADARLKQLEVAVRLGELFPVAQARLLVEGSFIGARQAFESLPQELASDLARESDPIQVEELLNAAIERALLAAEQNSKKLARGIFVSPVDLSLPERVRVAIGVIAEYSISLCGRGGAGSAHEADGGSNE